MSATDEGSSEISNACSSSGCCAQLFFRRSTLLGFGSAVRAGGVCPSSPRDTSPRSNRSWAQTEDAVRLDQATMLARGALLAQIRHQDLKNQLDQAAAAVTQAEAQHLQATQDYERAKALYSTHSLTKPEFDQTQARFDSTEAAVDQAKASLRQSQLALADADLGGALFRVHPCSQYRTRKSGVARNCRLHYRRHQRGQNQFRCSRVRR